MRFFSSLLLLVWEFCKRHPGILLVIIGVAGEGIELFVKLSDKIKNTTRSRKFEIRLDFIGVVFWIVLIIGLVFEMSESGKIDRQLGDAETEASEAKKQVSITESNLAALNKATIELAHQYDLSTNALAVANARLSSVSNEVAKNSPINLPIQSVDGDGWINIGTKDKAPFVNSLTQPVLLYLKEAPNLLAVHIFCQIDRIETNYLGDVALHIRVKAQGDEADWRQDVTCSNVRVAYLDLSEILKSRFATSGGTLSLRINSFYYAGFSFLPQTNSLGGSCTISGYRRD
jgi:hypothetical protein